jgi:sec-independent protein translocase protein TatB
MLDFSFGKLAIIFALCLIVLGPEKLPKLAQTLGRFAGQARAMARHFSAQLEQEVAAGELAKQKQELEAAVRNSMDAVSAPITSTAKTVEDAAADVLPYIDPSAANNSGHADAPAEEPPPADSASADSSNHAVAAAPVSDDAQKTPA